MACEKNIDVIEKLIINPNKFSEKELNEIQEHVFECYFCQDTLFEAEEYARRTGKSF